MEPGESDEECDTLGIFAEPEGFYEPEKQPTTVSHQLLNGKELSLRLVGHSPLWVGDQPSLHSEPAFHSSNSFFAFVSHLLEYQSQTHILYPSLHKQTCLSGSRVIISGKQHRSSQLTSRLTLKASSRTKPSSN